MDIGLMTITLILKLVISQMTVDSKIIELLVSLINEAKL